MAENCIALEDVAYVSEAWRLHPKVRLADGARARDALVLRPRIRIEDVVTAGDSFTPRRFAHIEEEITVGEQWRLRAYPRIRITDVVRARDSVRGHETMRFADSVQASDALRLGDAIRLADGVTVSDDLELHGSPRIRIADVVRVTDSVQPRPRIRLADEVQAGDELRGIPRLRLMDSASVAEAWRLRAYPRIRLADAVTVADTFTPVGHPSIRIADEVFVGDRFRIPAEVIASGGHIARRVGTATAWTANTDTWGGSRYTNFEFNSLAVVDGVLMGANDAGLWRLDAQDDDGEPILAHVQTDMQDYGAEQVKSAPLVYAGAATDGAMQLTVDAVIKGTPGFFTYTFEPRHAGDFAPTRCKVGRGVRSRYMQFTVGNHSGDADSAAGADFTIDQLSVLAEAGSRRV